jgi:hypothetical protein
MDPAFSINTTRARDDTDISKCIICQTQEFEKGPLNNVTNLGYDSLLFAVENRQDDVAHRLDSTIRPKEEFIQRKLQWHKQCRNNYTHKKTVAQHMTRKRPATCSSSAGDSSAKKRETTSKPNHNAECFICDKTRSNLGDRSLRLVSTRERQVSVWQKAQQLQDDNMLTKIDGFGDNCIDMTISGFQYHLACMNNYLTIRTSTGANNDDTTQLEQSFHSLVCEINAGLFENDNVYYVTALRDRYRELLAVAGFKNASTYRTAMLKQRLLTYYSTQDGCRVMVFSQPGMPSILCSTQLNVGTLLAEIDKLKKELADNECLTESDDDETVDQSKEQSRMSFNAAKHIRCELKEQGRIERKRKQELKGRSNENDDVDAAPSTEDELSSMGITYAEASKRIHNSLYNHVAWMLTDEGPCIHNDGRVHLKDSLHEQVLNLSQDICSAVANIPTPKQVGTALHVLKETRSKDTVTLLNRLGNSISYQDAQRYITTIAMSADRQVEEDGYFVPTNVQTGLFTQFAIDNLDFHEHTKDGQTLHATTHNIYQYDQSKDSFRTPGVVPVVKTRDTSLKSAKPFTVADCHLSAKDRQKSRSLSGVALVTETNRNETIDNLNLIWQLIRMTPTQLMSGPDCDFLPPTWSYFNEFLIPNCTEATQIGYGPIFPKSPTDPAVVESSLRYCMQVAIKLGQDHTVVTCDQAIYEIALALQRRHPQTYDGLILRMGGFHIASNFLGAIGKFMRSSGLEDILSQAAICLPGTANKIMAGKDYYLMLRAHSLVSTAMFELLWESFERWLLAESRELEGLSQLATIIGDIIQALKEKDEEKAASACESDDTTKILGEMRLMLSQFMEIQCTAPTTKLWLMYIETVTILKRYIHSERAGEWQHHLDEVENMMPYLVAAGHHKYVSCLPHYVQEMRDLSNTAPDVDAEFKRGNFTVRQTPGKFNGVWTDMALEQTYTCDAKTELFHGITQKPAAMEKYLRVAPTLTAISSATKAMAHMNETKKHHEDSSTLAVKENDAVTRIKAVVKETMIDPFSCPNPTDLLNISTGEKAISQDLIHAKAKGLAALQEAQDKGSEKIQPMRLQTFEITKKRGLTTSKRVQKVYEDETSVSRSLYFVQDLDEEKKKEALSHEWTKYPGSLFEPNADLAMGYGMRKGNKSDYVQALKTYLKDNWPDIDTLPPANRNVAYVVDAMAFIQRHQAFGCPTFEDLQDMYMQRLLQSKPHDCKHVNFVGDRYDISSAKSLKQEEREKREINKKTVKEYEPHDALDVPDWKHIGQSSYNKSNLLRYIGESWITRHASLPDDLRIIVGGLLHNPGKTVEISKRECQELTDLSCEKHEEADSRMFAHVAYCVQEYGCDTAVIQATDTDVIVLGMYFSVRIQGLKELWIQKFDKLIPLHDIVKSLSEAINVDARTLTGVLLTTYIMSGCDTVSYPYRRGKKQALAVALTNMTRLSDLGRFAEPGTDYELVSAAVMAASRYFFAALYGRCDFSGSIDELRAHLFATSKGDLRALPPTEDAFKLHVLRSLNQIIVCKTAHMPMPNYPDPLQFGRHIVQEDKLVATMMTKPARPKTLDKPSSCKCRTGKCLRNCRCAKLQMRCSISCLCGADVNRCGRVAMYRAISDSDEDD